VGFRPCQGGAPQAGRVGLRVPSGQVRGQNGGGSTLRSWSQFTWLPVYRASQGSVGPERTRRLAWSFPAALLPPACSVAPFAPAVPFVPVAPFAPDAALLRRRARSANSAT